MQNLLTLLDKKIIAQTVYCLSFSVVTMQVLVLHLPLIFYCFVSCTKLSFYFYL